MFHRSLTGFVLIIYLFFTGNIGIFLGQNTGVQKAEAVTSAELWAGTVTDLGNSNFSWANPTNLQGNTTNTSTSINNLNTNPALTNTLSVRNFNFSSLVIPTGSTINGVSVSVEWNGSNNNVQDQVVQLTKNGSSGVGTNLAANSGQTTKGFRNYGGAAELWGSTWTLAEIESANFGVLLQYRKQGGGTRDVNVYRVGITIDYTPPVNIIGGGANISTNSLLWLKSNQGTSTTSDGGALNTWSDQSGNNINANAVVAPVYRNNANDNLNFYPTVDFNGSTHYMNNSGLGVSSQNIFTVVVPNNTVNAALTGQVPFGVECVDARLNTGTCGLPFGGITLGNFTAALTDEIVTFGVGASTAYRVAQTGTASYQAGRPLMVNINQNSAGNGADIYEKGNKIDNISVNPYQFLSNTNYSLGRSTDDTNPFYFAGKIAEVINFEGIVTNAQRKIIESYLAYKYGITKENGTTDYTASDGLTTMWSSSVAQTFTNNVFGIGRDETQGLRQPQSRGVGEDNILTLQAVGQGTNISPNLTNISDMEFFTVSNDSGGNTWTGFSSPQNYLVLERKWKAQEAGDVGNVNFDFDVDNLNFNIPNLDAGTQYYLIYDTNGDRHLSDETPIAMTNVGGSIWRASNINMSHNTIFTLATELEIDTSVPVLSVNFSDNTNGDDVQGGQVIQYTIQITNTGIDASNISAVAPIDEDLHTPYGFTSSNCGAITNNFSNNILTFSDISVTSGNTCIIEYYAQVRNNTQDGANIRASIDASVAIEGGNDPDAINLPTLNVVDCTVNNVSLSFVTDNWGEDTFWSLVPSGNACGIGEVASGGNPNLSCDSGGAQIAGIDDPYPDNTTITEGPYSLDTSTHYDLYVIDNFGDGNTATGPHVLVSQNGATTDTYDVTGVGGFFTFSVQQKVFCDDTVSPDVTINKAPSQESPTNLDSATFQVIFNEAIDISSFTGSDITLSGTTGSITSGPTEVAPFNYTTFEFTITGMTIGDTVTATIAAGVVSDTSGNLNNASTSIDNQVIYHSDVTPPEFTSTSFQDETVLPGGNHSVIINYTDDSTGVDISSAELILLKWDGSAWRTKISEGHIITNSVTSTQAAYSIISLEHGKYKYVFSISDNTDNIGTLERTFYIDKPLFSVSTGEIDIGNINSFTEVFSPTVTVTVETVGVGFQVFINRKNNLVYDSQAIESFNGTSGYGFRPSPLTGNLQTIGNNQAIVSEGANINTDGERNIYTYEIQVGAIIQELQAAGLYEGSLDFSISLDYQ